MDEEVDSLKFFHIFLPQLVSENVMNEVIYFRNGGAEAERNG